MCGELNSCLRAAHDFPKPGVKYWDTTPLLCSPPLFRRAVAAFRAHLADLEATCIAAIEAKGFPIGAAVAYAAELPLILLRKPGLTPGRTRERSFVKEYGTGAYQLKADALRGGERIYLLYDILAGPGATQAAAGLIGDAVAILVGAGYVVELEYLQGRQALSPLALCSLVRIAHPDAAPEERP